MKTITLYIDPRIIDAWELLDTPYLVHICKRKATLRKSFYGKRREMIPFTIEVPDKLEDHDPCEECELNKPDLCRPGISCAKLDGEGEEEKWIRIRS